MWVAGTQTSEPFSTPFPAFKYKISFSLFASSAVLLSQPVVVFLCSQALILPVILKFTIPGPQRYWHIGLCHRSENQDDLRARHMLILKPSLESWQLKGPIVNRLRFVWLFLYMILIIGIYSLEDSNVHHGLNKFKLRFYFFKFKNVELYFSLLPFLFIWKL